MPETYVDGSKTLEKPISRPIQMNWMRKVNKKALKVQVALNYVMVQTEDCETGVKGISIFKNEDKYRGKLLTTGAAFNKQNETFFKDYENHIEILDMYGMPLQPDDGGAISP